MLMDISSEMIHGLLPIYLVSVLGASPFIVGIIEGVAEATQSVVKIFSGAISDRLGKRKILAALGYGLAAVTKPVFPLAQSIGWVVAARFVDRIGKGIRGAPRDALIADVTPDALRGAAFGLRQSLDTIGAFLGPALAILIMWASADSYRLVFAVAVVPAVLSFLLIAFVVEEPERPATAPRPKTPLSRRELRHLGSAFWWVVGLASVFTLARFSEAFLILKAEADGLDPALAPLVLVVMNLAYAATSYPAGKLADRAERTPVLAAGFALLIAADLVLALVPGLAAAMVGIVLWGVHMGLTQGVFAAMVADAAPAELRGTAFGVYNLASGAALLVASVLAGGLWALGPSATFLAGSVFTALALAGLVAKRKSLPRQAARQA
ncbi:MAG: MFS transporter [Bauldia sp.]